MIIKAETNLCDFTFWSGGRDNARLFTLDEIETIEATLEELYPEGLEDVKINDMFWFEPEMLAEWVGTDIDSLYAREEA
jgi:predicted DNA-binding transcriptional regulator YafY